MAGELRAQAITGYYVPPRAEIYNCAYIDIYTYIEDPDAPGGMRMLQDTLCCYDTDIEVARNCSAALIPGGWYEQSRYEVLGCQPGANCKTPTRNPMACPQVEIMMKCCSCTGETYFVLGQGSTWCAALADAKKDAAHFGPQHGGLRCYYPPANPCNCHCNCSTSQRRGVLRRIFCR